MENIMAFSKFHEFLDKKAKIELVADYPGKAPNAPPQGKGASPYKQGTDCKQMTMKGEKDQEPLNDKKKKEGDCYCPKDLKVDPVDGKQLDSWPKSKDAPKPKAVRGKKTKNEQFIEKTSSMSLAEFHDFMRERLNIEGSSIPPVIAHNKGRTFPDPVEATRYIVAVAKANTAVMENLAHEIRRQDVTKDIVAHLLDFTETYTYLSEILSEPIKGSSRLRNLSKKLTEIVGNPIGFAIDKKVNIVDDGDTADDPDVAGEDDEYENDESEEIEDEEEDELEDQEGEDEEDEEGPPRNFR